MWRGEKWRHRWLLIGVNTDLTLTGTLHLTLQGPRRRPRRPTSPLLHTTQPPCEEETRWPWNPYLPHFSTVDIASQQHGFDSKVSDSLVLSVCIGMNQLVLFPFLQNWSLSFPSLFHCVCVFPEKFPSPQLQSFFLFCCVNNCRLVMNVVIKGTAVQNGTSINRNFCRSRQTHLIAQQINTSHLKCHLMHPSPIFTYSLFLCVVSYEQPC